jgi:NTP pyrophosphatase (non-canonical NTP hydrolase)
MTNKPLHQLCTDLQNQVAACVGPVQQAFDAYQNTCFIARPAEFFCLELCGEAGELANLEKKLWKGADIATHRLEEEAADVLISLMNYANARGIDLAAAVTAKLAHIPTSK